MKKILFGLFLTISLSVLTFITLQKGEENGQQHVMARNANIKQTEEAWEKIQAAEPALAASYLELTTESTKIEKEVDDHKLFTDRVFKGFVLSMAASIFLAVCAMHEWNAKRGIGRGLFTGI